MAGEFDQFKPGEIRQALIAQQNVKGSSSHQHLLQCPLSTVASCQLSEAVTFKQVLSRHELEGMIFHQQDA